MAFDIRSISWNEERVIVTLGIDAGNPYYYKLLFIFISFYKSNYLLETLPKRMQAWVKD